MLVRRIPAGLGDLARRVWDSGSRATSPVNLPAPLRTQPVLPYALRDGRAARTCFDEFARDTQGAPPPGPGPERAHSDGSRGMGDPLRAALPRPPPFRPVALSANQLLQCTLPDAASAAF